MDNETRQAIYYQVRDIFREAEKEHRKAQSVYDMAYWQGRKNLARNLLAELAPDAETRQSWELYNEAASGGCVIPSAAIKAIAEDAWHVVDNVKYDLEKDGKLSSYSRKELKRWQAWFERLAVDGILKKK